jgi:protein O-mannosyl-transferase
MSKTIVKNKKKEITKPQKSLWPLIVVLVISVLIIYFPAFKNGLLNWDDNLYITDNNQIKSLENIPLFFSQFYIGNYQPLTLFAYSLIYQFAELQPFLYHFTNVLFHLFNTLLIFYFVKSLIKNTNIAFLVALLFAIHPMHVESVAWVSGLKDVLYTFFFFVSLICYLKFIRKNKKLYYLLSIVFFLFSLLSKGQAVVLFPVLFLVDYLERGKLFSKWIEKIPFFILSVVFGIMAMFAQKSANTMGDLSSISFFEQLALACYSFTMYIIKILFPFNLSSFYPYPTMVNGKIPSEYWLFLLVIPLVAYFLFRFYKKNKWLFFGVLFFIINIILLIQMIPVGNCIMADRYTYISAIGLNIVIISLFLKYFEIKKWKYLLTTLLSGYFIFLAVTAYNQTKKWKNEFTLWDNVLKVYPDIPFVLVLRGCEYNTRGEYDKAMVDFDKAISLDSKDGSAYFNRGVAKSKIGDFKNAIPDFEKADELKIEKKHFVNLYVSWGGALANTGKLKEAMKLFDKAIDLDPNDASVYNNRGITKAMLGDTNGAITDFDMAIKLNPEFTDAINNKNRAMEVMSKK